MELESVVSVQKPKLIKKLTELIGMELLCSILYLFNHSLLGHGFLMSTSRVVVSEFNLKLVAPRFLIELGCWLCLIMVFCNF